MFGKQFTAAMYFRMLHYGGSPLLFMVFAQRELRYRDRIRVDGHGLPSSYLYKAGIPSGR